MKKLVSLMSAAILVFGLAVPSYAASGDNPGTQTQITQEVVVEDITTTEISEPEIVSTPEEIYEVEVEENISEEYVKFVHPVHGWERDDLVITTETITTTTIGTETTVVTTVTTTVIPGTETTTYKVTTVRQGNSGTIKSQTKEQIGVPVIVKEEPIVTEEVSTEINRDVEISTDTQTVTSIEEGQWSNWFNPGKAKNAGNLKK